MSISSSIFRKEEIINIVSLCFPKYHSWFRNILNKYMCLCVYILSLDEQSIQTWQWVIYK